MGFQPLDPQITIDPFVISSFTGPDNHTGIYIDADQVNSSVLIQTNDTNALYIDKFHNVGINTSAPAAQLDINSADGTCIQLTYNNSSNKSNINVASDGKLSLITSGEEVNIDSSSDFNIKSHNGSSKGLKLNNTLVRATADQLNYVIVSAGTASASKALVVDSNKDISGLRNFTADNLTGVIQTASQPNITSVSNLDITSHNGSTVGLSLNGTLITSTAAKLNYVDVIPGSASATKALVLNSNLDISGIHSLSSTLLTGTLQTAAQPNITSVGTLTGLNIEGSLLGLTNLSINTTTTGRTLVVNSDVGNCFQLCYDTATGSSTNFVDFLVSSTGNLSLTPSGGNIDITSHDGSTIGLKLGGTLVTATASQINYLQGTTLGSASSGKALIFDSSRNIDNINNLTATNLTGSIQTASQPNINSVNVLNIANHNGSTIGLRLGGTLVTATATELNYVDTIAGTAEASKAIILDSNKDISGINSLSSTNITGTIQTASQPNITSVSTLNITNHDGSTQGLKLAGVLITATATQINSIFSGGGGGGAFGDLSVSNNLTLSGHNGTNHGLILGSTLVTATANQLNYNVVSPGTAAASKTLVLDSNSSISGINNLGASTLTLGSATISESEIVVLDAVTPGIVTASKAIVVDSNKDISSFRNLIATNLTGQIQTAAQPLITSVGTLSSLAVSSSTTTNTYTTAFSTVGNSTITFANTVNGFAGGINITGFNSTGVSKNVIRIEPKYSVTTNNSESTGCDFYTLSSGTAYTPFRILASGGCKVSSPSASSTVLAISGNITSANQFGDLAFETTNSTLGRYRAIYIDSNTSRFEIYGRLSGSDTLMYTLDPTGSGGNMTNLNSVTSTNFVSSGSITGTVITATRPIRSNNSSAGMTLINSSTASQNNVNPFYNLATSISNFTTFGFGVLTLGNNFMQEGYVNPGFTETYTFVVTYARCYFKLWIDGVLVLNNTSIDSATSNTLSFATASIAGIKKHVHLQAVPTNATTNSGSCVVSWSSTSRSSETVPFNSSTGVGDSIKIVPVSSPNILTVYDLVSSSITPLKGEMIINSSGNMTLKSSGLTTLVDATNSFDVASHNGTTLGLKLAGSLVTATATQLNYNVVTPGTVSPSKAIVVDSNKDISSFRNLTATNLTGQIQTAAQPNITSVGTLTSITTSGSLTLGSTAISESEIGVLDAVTPGTASASKVLVLNSNLDISGINSLTATNITGQLQTAAQPNITSVGTLTSITTSGSLTLGSTAISQSEIGVLDGVTPGTASASKALVLDSSKDIVGINNLSANELSGTIQTASQPNITSVAVLDITNHNGSTQGLKLGGVLLTATASQLNSITAGTSNSTFTNATVSEDLTLSGHNGTTHGLILGSTLVMATANEINYNVVSPGTASASKTIVLDSNLDISGINSLSATNLTGQLQTAAQPNITSVGTLTSITTSGSLTLGSTSISESEIAKIDGVTPGTASATKALVLDSNKDITGINSLTATNFTGELQTAAQPNITSVGTLTSITTSGSLTLGSTSISESEIAKIDGITPGTASASKALVLDANKDITGINKLVANILTGTIETPYQPNITDVENLNIISHNGSTTGLSLGGVLVTSTATELNYVDATPGTATASKSIILDASKDISGINSLSATNLTGQLQTAAQPNITSVGTLTSITTSGSLTLGSTSISESEIAKIDGITPGTASASKALVLDSNLDISGINSLSATNLTGQLQTAAQPNITSVGTLTSITTSGSLTLGSTSISESEIAKIDGVTPGTASASKALVLDSNKDISTIHKLTTEILAVGSPANTNLPVEIGYTTYQYTGAYAYSNDANAHGLVDAGNGPSANYSLRADGRILVTGEIGITSDRRLKENVMELTYSTSKKFIMTTTPVKFNWKNGDGIKDYGYIAQDVLKAGFDDLVTVVPHPGMEGSIDEDGFINPDGAKFTLGSGKIVPLLALNQREIFSELSEKDQKIANLEQRLAKLEQIISKLS
jgi:hypothetical protein